MPAFSRFKLLLRNLRHFRAANIAVIAGTAVATAVLTGALMVGDSVRGSLHDLAQQRLGFVDHVLVAPQFVSQSLAQRLADQPDFKKDFDTITPGITLQGGASREEGKSRVPGVQITALADRYPIQKGDAAINAPLADALTGAGQALRFSLPTPDQAPRDSTLARRSRNDTILSVSVPKSHLAPVGGFLDFFNLSGSQRRAPAAWLNLAELQDNLDRADQANLFLVAARSGHTTPADADTLNRLLAKTLTLNDYGLDITQSSDKTETVLGSKSTYIHPAIAQAADDIAKSQNIPLRKVSVYLINTVAKIGGDQPATLHYALAAGISSIDDKPLAENEIAVNQWTADQLHLKLGDKIRLDYYQRQTNGDLTEVASDRPGVGLTFTLAKILPMQGLGADPALTPTFKGLTDADTIADWRPPAGVTINKKLVTPADEKYWNQYKAAPKLFVSLDAAKKLWGNAFGDLTSLRIPTAQSKTFEDELQKSIHPAEMGLLFRPIRDQQLQAASGSTEFAGLFIGFSFFLLLAAVMLVAMLFRLSIEQRARQLGLLSACGFAPRQLRNLSLKEGLLLAVIGSILGIALAVAYTALMVYGLRTWWVGAIGTTALRLHVVPETLIYGLVGSIIVALLAILWAVRRIAKISPASLLAGSLGQSPLRLAKPPKISWILTIIGAAGAIALFAAGAFQKLDTTAAFLGGGSLLLFAALAFTYIRLRPAERAVAGLSLPTLALRNATRNRTRSLLCVALIALATFTLVTASSMESAAPDNTFNKSSGSGGYALIVQTDIPLHGDLNTLPGRQLLMRLPSAKDPRWDNASFVMMRRWAGQDISCLNITQPTSPTILAVPPSMRDAARFTFAQTTKPSANPWDLLDTDEGDDTIPVIADDESAQYILKLNLGQTLPLIDATGHLRKLKLVATLSGSIFQSEMLMSESNFLKLFPAQSGYNTILVETTPQHLAPVTNLLREALNDTNDKEMSDYSATIQTTAARLAAYHEVANTYLATFRVLGALGLMLGTIGLAVVLIRNLIERRPELALLSALGFNPTTRTRLVLWENISLLLLGLLIGALCALAGVIPNVLTSPHRINIPALSVALVAVLVIGLLSLWIAVSRAGRKVTAAALRVE